LLGTPSVRSIHDYYPFALEDGDIDIDIGLAHVAAELVDRLAISVGIRRFPCMGVVDSRSLRYNIYVRTQHFVCRTTCVPFRRFGGALGFGGGEFMHRLYGTLVSYLRDALQEGSANAVACLLVPRA
jgi:hypothetical protein